MGRAYNINLNEISIDSWKMFVDNNEIIERGLNSCCSNVADMIANIDAINATVPEVNKALGKLKTVTAPPINSASELHNKIVTINDYMKDKSVVIISTISYAEKAIEAFQNGEEVDSLIKEEYLNIMQNIADSNIYWVAYALLEKTPFSAIGFTLAYGTDAAHEDAHFVVGDGMTKLFGEQIIKFYDIVEDGVLAKWVNLSVGTASVAIFTGVLDLLTDKGKMTSTDWKRLGLDTAFGALSYAEWTLVAGAIGGVPGVIVAAALAIPTAALFNYTTDLITHENIIDTFERNGNTYEVPANGKGEYGTFDVITEEYIKKIKHYKMGDRIVSEHEFKEYMYSDFESFINDEKILNYNMISDKYSAANMKNALDAMVACDTFEEGLDAYNSYYRDPSGLSLMMDLSERYGFNLEEYYNYKHKG